MLECVRAMALAGLQDLEMKKKQAVCKDTLSDEISLLEKTVEKYNREKFTVYDEYTKGKVSREVMAERNAAVKQQIEETKKLIDEKMEKDKLTQQIQELETRLLEEQRQKDRLTKSASLRKISKPEHRL